MSSTFEYELYLCDTSYPYAIKGCLTNCTHSKIIKTELAQPNELSFIMLDRYIDGTDNDLFTEIEQQNVIQVDTRIDDVIVKSEKYHISKVNLKGNVSQTKEIKAFSLETRMNKQYIRGFDYNCQIYTGTWDTNDIENSGIVDYILTLFNNNWSVNYVSSSLTGIFIDFNIQESKVLPAVKIIEQNFNCIFMFDTDNQTIDIVAYDDTYDYFSTNTGLILDHANYVTQYTSQINVDTVATRLFIYGLDGADISTVNVTGELFLDDFSVFMNSTYMTSDLITALNTVNGLRTSNQAAYTSLLSDLSSYQIELTTLQSELADLESELDTLEDGRALAIINGGTYGGKTYSEWVSEITSKESEITSKESEITSKNSDISSTNSSLDSINTTVSYSSTLTSDELKDLSNFIQEDTIRIDSDDSDVLLSIGQSYLDLKADQQYNITIDLVDVFSCSDESYSWDKIAVGRKVNLVIGDDIFEPFITSITHNVDGQKLSVTVSNKNYLSTDFDYVTSMWAKTNQNKTYLDNNKENWNTAKIQSDTAIAFTESPINVENNSIVIGDGTVQQVTINRNGIYFRESENANGQLRVLADKIVATNDNWNTYSLAIDSNGIKTSGTFKLITENSYGGSNLVTIDGNGIKIYGSETEGEGLIIYNKSDVEVFKLDTSGNIVMTGSINITGGNVGDLAFEDDLDGVPDGSTYKRVTTNEKTGAGRAYAGLNASNSLITSVIPATAITPSGAGLYLGSNYMGYYDSSNWKTYMDNTGKFYLGGTSGKLQWDGSTLSIEGNITITGGSGIASLTDAGSLATLNSVGASNCDTTIISGGRIITGLLTADNIQAGTLTGRTIRTASSGARIEMTNSDVIRMYNSSNQLHGMYIDPNTSNVDWILYKDGSELFKIRDDIGSVTLSLAGDDVLYYGADNVTYIEGDWDVDDATFIGTKKIHVGTTAPSDTSGQTIWIDTN